MRIAAALSGIVMVAAMPAIAAIPAPSGPPATVAPQKIIAAVTGSFANDGTMNRAVLIADPDNDSADLVIYAADDSQAFKPAGFAHDIAYVGAMFGTMPELRITKSGALSVYSENTGVGRDKWEQTLTLAYRNGQYVVAGFTLNAWDGLDPNGGVSCDINYLSGKGVKNTKTKLAVISGGIPLGQWSDDKIPKACQS